MDEIAVSAHDRVEALDALDELADLKAGEFRVEPPFSDALVLPLQTESRANRS